MKKVICGIYKITSPSGKIYIGESKNVHKRFSKYRNYICEDQTKLYRSLKKYNVENHIFEIIEECLFEDLLCRERHWQDFYDVCNRSVGLNLKLTQCGDKKQVLSEESITKIILSTSGENNHFYGKKHSEESISVIREKAKLRVGELNSFFGKTHSEETKTKNREAHLGLRHNKKTCDKMSEQRMGNKYSRTCKVIDIETLVVYNSIKEAATFVVVRPDTLRLQLIGKSKNKTNLVLLEEYEKLQNEKK